ALVDDVLRRDPFIPSRAWCLHWQAIGFAMQRDFETAVAKLRESVRLEPLYSFSRVDLARCLANIGRTAEAQEAIDEVRRLYPALTLDCIVANVRHLRGDEMAADYSRAIGGLWESPPS
ncbi:MAG TPA: tetratricopeptide repeat protein, partial [Pseudomonadales bacterium]|nr:tetratricopeptide repeat protein [Pseudomonadales bacterium]